VANPKEKSKAGKGSPVRGMKFLTLPQANGTSQAMKKIKASLLLVLIAASTGLGGCAYGGAAAMGDKLVILRNDSFLFGALRKVYVCKVTDAGLSNCQLSAEAP
jgi:hypothetical protein